MAAQLDPTHEFDSLLITILAIAHRKGADYAEEENIYSNFDSAAQEAGLNPIDAANILIGIKNARIRNLRDKDPQNESLLDSYLDRAVYSILAYGLALRDKV